MSVGKWVPVMYAMYYGDMQEIAREHGYALAIHGSLMRDMDLVLIPWVDNPKPYMDVLRAWSEKRIGFERVDKVPYDTTAKKPHGRIAFTMHTGGGGYIDISIINGIEEKTEDARSGQGETGEHLTTGQGQNAQSGTSAIG